jgi:hypothetical protein
MSHTKFEVFEGRHHDHLRNIFHHYESWKWIDDVFEEMFSCYVTG